MDRIARRATEERVVTISEVDMTSLTVVARDQYGSSIEISMHLSDGGITSVPAAGEIWTVQRSGNEWFLDKKSDDGSESVALTALQPGDRRIEASGDLHLNASGTVYLNGQAASTPGYLLVW